MKKTPAWKRKGIIATFLIVTLIVVSGILAFHPIGEVPPEIPPEMRMRKFPSTYPLWVENYSYILSNGNIDMVRVEFLNYSDMDVSGTLSVVISSMIPTGPFSPSREIPPEDERLAITIPARSTEIYVVDIEDVPFQWTAENRSVCGIFFSLENRTMRGWILDPFKKPAIELS